ncbi:TetR/AcrR family transcriptional regulator [Mucilaginibacter litoreus]|uniref:TetR/AcrR family transcriptional regulator n=1 Tax=Mucilaginibacter litoreus TaxID=1048221 RepID=A0ABW3AYJ7_9SPHI
MTRKKYQGAVNDKERSMQKLIDAVGVIIKTKGYTGLGPTNIAKCAGLNKKLIYLYFGSVENLIEIYVKGKDYWVAATGNAGELMEKNKGKNTKDILEALLVNQLDYFYQEEEMQKIVLWQISERTKIMYDVCEERERLGDKYFELADQELKNSSVDIRAIAGLLVGGIYHMVLHAKSTDSLFCQIDVNQEDGKTRIKTAIKQILNAAYSPDFELGD